MNTKIKDDVEADSLHYESSKVIYQDKKGRVEFESRIIPSKKTKLQLEVIIPEDPRYLESAEPVELSTLQTITAVIEETCYEETGLNVQVSCDPLLSKKLLSGINRLFRDIEKKSSEAGSSPKEEKAKMHKGFQLQDDLCSVVNTDGTITITHHFHAGGTSLIYSDRGKTLTLACEPEFLSEVLYVNTVTFETPTCWDSPHHEVLVSDQEIQEMKQNIKNAMDLFQSLVFFEERPHLNDDEQKEFIQRQLRVIGERAKKVAKGEK